FSAASPSTRGVVSTAAEGARYGALYSLLSTTDTIFTVAANITRATTGPRTNSSLRLVAAFIPAPPSVGARGRGRAACQALALELSHVGDDRPPVRRRDRPAVAGHQPSTVRDHLEEVTVGVLEDLLLVERGGRDVASLEQEALSIPARIVAGLGIDLDTP